MAQYADAIGPDSIVTVWDSAARTATPDPVYVDTEVYWHMELIIDVTAVTATPSVVFGIHLFDPLSGKTVSLLDSAAITGTGTTRLELGPEVSGSPNLVAQTIVPPIIAVTATHADADSITYSVSAHFK